MELFPFLWGWEQRAQFGNMFGAIASLFSGLAFAVLIVTMILQKEELKSQRQQLNEQNRTLRQQQFEATFFKLLDWYDNKRRSLRIVFRQPNGGIMSGVECLVCVVGKINNGIPEEQDAVSLPRYIEQIESNYEHVLREHNEVIVPYMRTLYNTVRYFDKSEIDDKGFCANLVRAFLTGEEMDMILLYCALDTQQGTVELKGLIETYGILWGFTPTSRLANELMRRLKPTAFGREEHLDYREG
jgi:hypothetical protein